MMADTDTVQDDSAISPLSLLDHCSRSSWHSISSTATAASDSDINDKFLSLLSMTSSLQCQSLFALLEKHPLRLEDAVEVFATLEKESSVSPGVRAEALVEECTNPHSVTCQSLHRHTSTTPSLSLEILLDRYRMERGLKRVNRKRDGVTTLEEWKAFLVEILEKDIHLTIEKAWARGIVYFGHRSSEDIGPLLTSRMRHDRQLCDTAEATSSDHCLNENSETVDIEAPLSEECDEKTPFISKNEEEGLENISSMEIINGEANSIHDTYSHSRNGDTFSTISHYIRSRVWKIRSSLLRSVDHLGDNILVCAQTADNETNFVSMASAAATRAKDTLMNTVVRPIESSFKGSLLFNPAWRADFVYYEKNMNPVFGLFFCDPHHPLTFLERLDIEFCVYGWVFFTSAMYALTKQNKEKAAGLGKVLEDYSPTNTDKYIASFMLISLPSMLLRVLLFYIFLCPCIVMQRKKRTVLSRYVFPALEALGHVVGAATFILSLCLYGFGVVMMMDLTLPSRDVFLANYCANWMLTNFVSYILWDFCVYFNPFQCCAPGLSTHRPDVSKRQSYDRNSTRVALILSSMAHVLRWVGVAQWQLERAKALNTLHALKHEHSTVSVSSSGINRALSKPKMSVEVKKQQ